MKQFIAGLLLCAPLLSLAQTEVRGRILTADGQPAAGITVRITEIDQSVSSTNSGHYVFPSVKRGTYTLSISAVGIIAKDTSIIVNDKRLQIRPVTLSESKQRLDEIVVQAEGRNPFARLSSIYVSKMPLKNLENSQSYAVITQELLRSQLNTNFDDALKNTSGIDQLWGATGRPGDGSSYYTLRGFTTQSAMVNGVVSINSTSSDPANIERIEVIKGPSGSLYGGAAIGLGGLINTVTKKPIDTLGGRINYILGSYNQHRVTADVYGPLALAGRLSGRLNAAYSHTGTYQDAGFNKSLFIAPSLLYRPNEKLDLQLDAEIYRGNATNPLMVFLNRSRQLYARTPDELAFDFTKSYTDNSVDFTNPVSTLRGQLTYRMGSAWTAHSTLSYNRRAANGYFQYVMYNHPDNDTLIDRLAAKQDYVGTTWNAQQNFIGDFLIGGLRNRLLVGADYLMQEGITHNSPYVLVDQLNTAIDDPAYGSFGDQAIDRAIAASENPETNNRNRSQVFGAYLSNVLDVTPKLHINAALRMDYFDNKGTYNYDLDTTTGNYQQLAFSPRVGVVYQLVKDQVSLFSNYQNGFKNVAPVVQPLPDISGDFKPQQAAQFEAGVKLQTFGDRLGLTVSYYDISLRNMTRNAAIERDGQTYNITVQDGTRLSRGVEFDITATPIDPLHLIISYSYNDSKITQAAESVNNLRPTEAGPAHLFNAWANYTVPGGWIKGLGLGLGVNHASENITTNSLPTGPFILPAYTLINASITYRYQSYEIGLKGNNLSDQVYFKGWSTVNPTMPRHFLASIAYGF